MNAQSHRHSRKQGYNSYLQWSLASDQGLRESMEDAYEIVEELINANLSMFAVFDGHGGKNCSHFLANNFSSTLQSMVDESRSYSEVLRKTNVLTDLCFHVDDQFRGQRQNVSGSTANAVFIENYREKYELTCMNVGDTRCLVYDRGTHYALSKDHKPTNNSEKKRIEESGGFVERKRLGGRLAMSRAFGDFEDKSIEGADPNEQPLIVTPDLQHLTLDKNATGGDDHFQFVVVACDGLFEVFSNLQVTEMVAEQLRNGVALADISENMVQFALQEGSHDNVTVIIILLS